MNIEDFTVEQLKAMAFDEIVKKDTALNNISVIQTELQKRARTPVVPVEQPKEGE